MDTLVDFLLNFYGPTPYLIILAILLACGLGLPMPEDITLFAAGLLSYYGVTHLGLTILIAFIGVLVGDLTIFLLGRRYGRKLTKVWIFHRALPDERLNQVSAKFKQRGNKLLFAARFMPGFRAPIFFSAGVLHVPLRTFLFYDGFAALFSVPLVIGAVFYFGDQLDHVVRIVKGVEHGIVLVIAAALFALLAKWYLANRKVSRDRVSEE